MAERVDGHVSTTAGHVPHGFHGVLYLTAVDDVGRAQGFGQFQFVVSDVYRHDIGAERPADHDRRQADAAAAMNCEPLAALQAPLIDDGGNEVAKRQPRPAAVS